MSGGRGITAEIRPERQRVVRGELACLDELGRVGQQERGQVRVGQLAGVPGVQRIVVHGVRRPEAVAGVRRPAGRKPERPEVGLIGRQAVLRGDDADEDHLHHLLLVQQGRIRRRGVGVGIAERGDRQQGGDGGGGSRPGGQEPGQAAASPVAAGQHDGDADRHGEQVVLLLGQAGQVAACCGQQLPEREPEAAPAEVHHSGRHEQQPGEGRALAVRAGVGVEERGVGHHQPQRGGDQQGAAQPEAQAAGEAGDAGRLQHAGDQPQRHEADRAGQPEQRGEPPGREEQQVFRGGVHARIGAGAARVEREVGEGVVARHPASDRGHAEPAHEARTVTLVGHPDRSRDQEPDDEQQQGAAEDETPDPAEQPDVRPPEPLQPACAGPGSPEVRLAAVPGRAAAACMT